MAKTNKAKYGYLSYSDMLLRIADGKLDAYDMCVCTDTKEFYVITPELTPFPIKSRVYVFNSVVEARTVLNKSPDTYVGQIVSILDGNVYRGYIVNKYGDDYDINPLYEQANEIDYNTLGNRPIINMVGTLDEPIVVSELLDGIYSIKGQYKINESEETIFLSMSSALMIVEHNSTGDITVKKITSSEITDYIINDNGVSSTSLITQNYLSEHGYTTTAYVDAKIAALNFVTKDEIDTYVANLVSSILDEILDEKIDEKLDEKLEETTEEQIINLFE